MKYFFLVLALVTVMFGCGDRKNTNYETLIGSKWELQQIVAPDSLSFEMPPVAVDIIFDDSSRISGFAGCNNFFGAFTTEGDKQITLYPLGRTMAACPYLEFEEKLMSTLANFTVYTAKNDELQLEDKVNGVTLLFKAKK